uniref:HTH CENPB-type domain-containing protein n=1 Tax=Trichogramma kaykai TaxID=54128 RepID=A0ABD2XC51_9HYME
MMRHYIKKSNRKCYSQQELELAFNEVSSGWSIAAAASERGILRTTLQNRVQKNSVDTCFQRVFNEEQELALPEYIVDMEKRLSGLTSKELRELAFDFAEQLGVPHPFDRKTGLAGEQWLSNFMERHELSNRKSEPTSVARGSGFNKVAVDKFFDVYDHYKTKYNFSASQIYNVDETGFTVNPKTSTRVIAERGT